MSRRRIARLETRVDDLVALVRSGTGPGTGTEAKPTPRFEDYLTEAEIVEANAAIECERRANPLQPPTAARPPEYGLALWTALSRMPARVRPSYAPDNKEIARQAQMYRTAVQHPRWLLARNHWRMRWLVLERNEREALGLERDDDLPRLDEDHPEEVAYQRYRDIEEALEYGFFPSGENCGDCGFGWTYLQSSCPMCGGEVGLDLYYRKHLQDEGSK